MYLWVAHNFNSLYMQAKLPHPTQLNTKLGRPYFPMVNRKTTNTKPQTVCHFFSATTQLSSTKFIMQPYFNTTRRFVQKN